MEIPRPRSGVVNGVKSLAKRNEKINSNSIKNNADKYEAIPLVDDEIEEDVNINRSKNAKPQGVGNDNKNIKANEIGYVQIHDVSSALDNKQKSGVFEELNPFKQNISQNDIDSSSIENGLDNIKPYKNKHFVLIRNHHNIKNYNLNPSRLYTEVKKIWPRAIAAHTTTNASIKILFGSKEDMDQGYKLGCENPNLIGIK